MLRPFSLVTAAIVLLAPLPPSRALAQVPFSFAIGATGISLTRDATLVAFSLQNRGASTASNVRITAIEVGDARLPATTPVEIADLRPGATAIAHASLTRGTLRGGSTYSLRIDGIAAIERVRTEKFSASADLLVPKDAPGRSDGHSATARANKTGGAPYPARKPDFSDEENGPRWVVPTVPGAALAAPTKSATKIERAPHGDPGGVNFTTNASLGLSGGSTTAEPSGSVGGGVTFITSNWYAAYSTGGAFTQLNPTTIFPNDAIGYCCDQIVQYVPSIDRFVWLLQGNGMRLATASPAQIKSSHGTAWTYWDLPPSLFGEPSGTGYDYPDLSVGTKYLYMDWDACWPGNPSGCDKGREIVRAPLSTIASGGSLGMNYTTASDSINAWGAHLSQDTGDTIYWGGQNNNASVRVFSWPESSSSYSWNDVGVAAWANSGITSTTPDGNDWMSFLSGFPNSAIIGATVSRGQLWFAWSAGTNKAFKQPHVEMIEVDPSKNSLTQQVQIWNSGYAFGYPSLATNACSNEIGLSLEYGGGGNYENHVVGFWGDYVVYITTSSAVGTTRFGDYVTIRQDPAPGGATFDAYGYGLDKGAIASDVHNVVFARTNCKQ